MFKLVKTIYIIMLILFCINMLNSEIIKNAESISLGGVQTVLTKNIYSLFDNPAVLCTINHIELGVSYMPLYGMEDLYSLKILSVLPLKNFTVGGGFYKLTAENLYHYSIIAAGIGFPLLHYLYSGITLKYIMTGFNKPDNELDEINDSTSAISINLGLFCKINKSVRLGICGKNFNNPQLQFSSKNYRKQDIRYFNFGAKINLRENFAIFVEEEFAKSKDLSTNFGAELSFYNVIFARVGMRSSEQLSVGTGVNLSFITINFGLNTNSEIGNLYQLDFILKYSK